jgi:hypothetical protein
MAVKRKKTAARRAPAKRRTTRARATAAPVRRKRRVTRKKTMLSELFNPAMAQAAGKTVISGAVGGAGAVLLGRILPETMDVKRKAFVTLGAAFVTSTILKMPNVGAGMAGVGMFNLLGSSGMLAEDDFLQEYNYANDLQSLPMVLDEDGMEYLQEESGFLQEASEFDYSVGYYPEFGM